MDTGGRQCLRRVPARPAGGLPVPQDLDRPLAPVPDGNPEPVLRYACKDEPGYTPFRKVPSSGSLDDILRCMRALFNVVRLLFERDLGDRYSGCRLTGC